MLSEVYTGREGNVTLYAYQLQYIVQCTLYIVFICIAICNLICLSAAVAHVRRRSPICQNFWTGAIILPPSFLCLSFLYAWKSHLSQFKQGLVNSFNMCFVLRRDMFEVHQPRVEQRIPLWHGNTTKRESSEGVCAVHSSLITNVILSYLKVPTVWWQLLLETTF